MKYLTLIRAFSGMLLAFGLASLMPANAQTSDFPENDSPRVSEAKPVKKTSFAFKMSEVYLAGGTAFDMTTTVRGLSHPTTADRSDGSFLAHYYTDENGWAGLFGKRDAFTAVAANVLLNVEIDRLSRKLYARGGHWRTGAFGINILKGTFNTIAAGYNIRNQGRIDTDVRLATGYRGQIVWSR